MWLRDSFSDPVTYFNLIYNKWVMLLLAAAILEMYSMHRIASELKKEEAKEDAEEKQEEASTTDKE